MSFMATSQGSPHVMEDGCQNKWCHKHHCREKDFKCSCTTERLLAIFRRGKKSVYGHFRCDKCWKMWHSALAWVENGRLLTQDCKICNYRMSPFKVVSFLFVESRKISFFSKIRSGEGQIQIEKLKNRMTRYFRKIRFNV